jgi:hypothetical protein
MLGSNDRSATIRNLQRPAIIAASAGKIHKPMDANEPRFFAPRNQKAVDCRRDSLETM